MHIVSSSLQAIHNTHCISLSFLHKPSPSLESGKDCLFLWPMLPLKPHSHRLVFIKTNEIVRSCGNKHVPGRERTNQAQRPLYSRFLAWVRHFISLLTFIVPRPRFLPLCSSCDDLLVKPASLYPQSPSRNFLLAAHRFSHKQHSSHYSSIVQSCNLHDTMIDSRNWSRRTKIV